MIGPVTGRLDLVKGHIWPYNGRTDKRREIEMEAASRKRSRRLELRTTPEERELLDRAVATTGTDLTDFVVSHASDAARRVLADRDLLVLDPKAAGAWEEINSRPARDLPGLRRLMERPWPFSE
jgi:uncharacterized protein (DUF1778 family)